MANSKRSIRSKSTKKGADPMEQAFEALQYVPEKRNMKPEGTFTRSEFAVRYYEGARTRATTALGRLEAAGKVKTHDQIGPNGRRYYIFVG